MSSHFLPGNRHSRISHPLLTVKSAYRSVMLPTPSQKVERYSYMIHPLKQSEQSRFTVVQVCVLCHPFAGFLFAGGFVCKKLTIPNNRHFKHNLTPGLGCPAPPCVYTYAATMPTLPIRANCYICREKSFMNQWVRFND